MITKLMFVTCIGAALEFFDFAILLLFAKTLSVVFLPDNIGNSLLWMYAIYSGGNIIRPIGGIIISHYGDKVGRKKLFRISIFMMAFATFGIAVLPGYEVLGMWSVVSLITFRLMQGLSVGGEFPGALVFGAEHTKESCRGLVTSTIIASALIGLLTASTLGLIINKYLSQEQVLSWGWRIPFFLGSLMGVLGYYLRKGIAESPAFEQVVSQKNVANIPIKDLFVLNGKSILIGIASATMATTMVSLYLYLPSYGQGQFNMTGEKAYFFSSCVMAGLFVFTIPSGRMADYIGRDRAVFVSGFLMLLVAWPASEYFISGRLWSFVAITIIPLSIILGSYSGMLVDIFNVRVRYTGVALSLNIAMCVFGAGTPYVLELLLHNNISVGPLLLILFVSICALVSGLAAMRIIRKHKLGLYGVLTDTNEADALSS